MVIVGVIIGAIIGVVIVIWGLNAPAAGLMAPV